MQQKDRQVPYWKALWDEARTAAREGNYERALQKYKILLQQKNELYEARWEFVLVLLHLNKKEQGVVHLELLLEKFPGNVQYIVKLAEVLHSIKSLKRAADLYGQAYRLDPDNMEVLAGFYRSLMDLDRKAEALPVLEAYYEKKKSNLAVRKELAALYYQLGRYKMAAHHFTLLADGPKVDSQLLFMAADTMDRLGHENVAIGYWQMVLEYEPQNVIARRRLTEFYTNEGKVSEALKTLLALLETSPKKGPLLHQIGKIYIKTGKPALGLAYLEKYMELRPDDKETLHQVVGIVLKLAKESLIKGDIDSSRNYLSKLDESESQNPEFIMVRALLFEKLYKFEEAILDYEKVVYLVPGQIEVKLRIIQLAGAIGDYGRVRQYYENLKSHITASSNREKMLLIYASALSECGALEEAASLFDHVIEIEKGNKDVIVEAYIGKYHLFQRAGLIYEAEQNLRIALHNDKKAASILFNIPQQILDYSLDANERDYWLSRLDDLLIKAVSARDMTGNAGRRKRLLLAEILASRQQYRRAEKICHQLIDEMRATNDSSLEAFQVTGRLNEHSWDFLGESALTEADVLLLLGDIYIAMDDWQEAESLFLSLNTYDIEHELERLVLLQKLYHQQGDHEKAAAVFSDAVQKAGRDIGAMMVLVKSYYKRHLYYETLNSVEKMVASYPQLLLPRLIYADVLKRRSDYSGSLSVTADIIGDYPDNILAKRQQANLLFQAGRYEDSLASCNDLLEEAGIPASPDIQRLKARNLWALNKWEQSLVAYTKYMEPSVDDVFEQESKKLGFTVKIVVPPKNIWDYLTFSSPKAERPIEKMLMLNDEQNTEHGNPELESLALSLYARYRWDDDFRQEFEARKAVNRREYLQAANLYEAIIEKKPQDTALLFDLAAVYSKLGRLGDEAAVYEKMSRHNAEFPGMQEAANRNRLKRRPKVYIGYNYSQEDGWDDYINIKKATQKTGLTFSPFVQQEVDVSFSWIRYQALESDQTIWARRAFLEYKVDIYGNLSFVIGGGVESDEDGINDTGVFTTGVSGKLGDKISGHVQIKRDLVTDTLASIGRNILRNDYTGGIKLLVLPTVTLGATYRYWDYSDNNYTQGYDLWGSYVIFQEPTFLQFSYSYEFKDSGMGPNPGTPAADGYAINDHPYWAPKNYWQNNFSLLFKHFLVKDKFDRGIPRYYTVEYLLGYDSRGYAIQEFKGGFYIEWLQKFVFELTGDIVSSQTYREKQIQLAIASPI